MMGVWCFYSGMGRRLRCEKSSSPVGEIRQGCFFCHNSSPQLQNPSPLGNFPTPLKQSNKAAFSLLFPLQNPLNFIKSNRHPSKNATYRLLFEKTLSYRLHFRLRKQKIMHPIFGVHDFYIVSSKIRLWWTKRNTIRTIFHFPTRFCAINSNENSTLILFDSFCTTNYTIICAFLQIIINMAISLDKQCTMCYNIITETGKNPKTKKKRK